MEDTQHYSLVLTPSFPGLPKEFYYLLHQLGGLIGVVLDAYIHKKDGQIFGNQQLNYYVLEENHCWNM